MTPLWHHFAIGLAAYGVLYVVGRLALEWWEGFVEGFSKEWRDG